MSTTILLNTVINQLTQKSDAQELLGYYEKAGPDYETWSPNFNMHFGYYEKGMNPFRREQMLQKMNQVVLKTLQIDREKASTLVDMGCGLGATLRYAKSIIPRLDCMGVTIVPWQKQQADQLNHMSHMDAITIRCEDYTRTALKSGSVDHVIAIESSCYAAGASKSDLLKEIHRVLRPGGTFVIADGFLKHTRPLKGILGKSYRQLCKS